MLTEACVVQAEGEGNVIGRHCHVLRFVAVAFWVMVCVNRGEYSGELFELPAAMCWFTFFRLMSALKPS